MSDKHEPALANAAEARKRAFREVLSRWETNPMALPFELWLRANAEGRDTSWLSEGSRGESIQEQIADAEVKLLNIVRKRAGASGFDDVEAWAEEEIEKRKTCGHESAEACREFERRKAEVSMGEHSLTPEAGKALAAIVRREYRRRKLGDVER